MERADARRSRCQMLGVGQLIAAGATAVVSIPPELRDQNLLSQFGGALAWAVLGVLTLTVGRRADRFFEASALASVLVVGYQSLIADRGQLQVFNAFGLLILGVLVATYLSRSGVVAYLVLVCVTFGLAAALQPLLVSWVLTVLVLVVVVINTLLVRMLYERNRDASLVDPLTGALNRTGLQEQAPAVRSIADRAGLPSSVAYIDLDGFKGINDTGGHAAGDRVLVDLVDAWRRELRPSDLVARVGGDEFVIVLPGTGPEDAAGTLHRLHSVSPTPWTAGLAPWTGEVEVVDVIDRADALMYQAKKQSAGTAYGRAPEADRRPDGCVCDTCDVRSMACPRVRLAPPAPPPG